MNEASRSTIAVSAYNVTALMGPMTPTELLNAFGAQQFVCDEQVLLDSLEEALVRGVLRIDGRKVAPMGPPGWVVWQRDDSLDPTGWTHWLCLEIKTKRTAPYEALLTNQGTDA